MEQFKRLNFFWPFFCLLTIEIITFGINVKHIGIYQDEWIYLGQSHFVPHSMLELIIALFWDPRIIVRPIEALHFGPLFYFVSESPLWYHVICYISEFLAAYFLFLTLRQCTRNSIVSLLPSILFLLYPTHDVTHYEIVASSLSISMAFFTLSLWLYAKGINENLYGIILCSGLAYFVSIYNYEFCLPLIVVYPMLYFLLQKDKKLSPFNLKIFALQHLPFLFTVFSMIVYRKWLLPSLGLGYNYATTYNCYHFLSVIWDGLIVNLSPYTLQFCSNMVFENIREGLSLGFCICLLIAITSIYIALIKEEKYSAAETNKTNLYLMAIGLIILLSSYTIYGFSPEHIPTIDTWLSRVNLGGSLGACLIIGSLLSMLHSYLKSSRYKFSSAIFASIIALFSAFLILVDWQFAKPWIVSWKAQKELMNVIKANASNIKSGDCIILGGIIRYASKWVPVVDGVWDFQSIVRTTLNNPTLKATVVTERLSINKDELIDKYNNIILGTFPFKNMILVAPKKGWQRVSSAKEFIEHSRRFGWTIPNSN